MREGTIYITCAIVFLLAMAGTVLVPTLYIVNGELKQQIANCPTCVNKIDDEHPLLDCTWCVDGRAPFGNGWAWCEPCDGTGVERYKPYKTQPLEKIPTSEPDNDDGNISPYYPKKLHMPERFNSWSWWERTRWAKSRNKSDYRDTEYWPNPVE